MSRQQGKCFHGFFELKPAAADVAERAAAKLDGRGLFKGAPGLVLPDAVHKDNARHDHGLRLFPRDRKPPLRKKDIQSFLHAFAS